jgi:MSHA biogenesis protein MshE
MVVKKKLRIGELLVSQQIITEAQLEQALERQIESGKKLGEVLLGEGYVTEQALAKVLAEQLDVSIIDLDDYDYDVAVAQKLPESYARRFRMILLSESEQRVLLGMVDPLDMLAMDEVARLFSKDVDVAIVYAKALQKALDLLYRRTDDISGFAEELGEELATTAEETDLAALAKEEVSDAPVIRLLQSIFEDAVQISATDIHIEPDENLVHIRLRVDGILQEQKLQNVRIAAAVSQRLKLMSGLNIAEKRLPQDGRFRIKVRGQLIDVRLSTMPIQHGESIVMRLLNQSMGLLRLEAVGMPEDMRARFRHLIHRPNGLILVTGPTGSGKTTTLYAALAELNTEAVKIITIEDPVEYRISGLNQVQVKPKIGLGFAEVLRSCLRQDPDIMLVGEMRDHETAEIAIRSALTGHLVLSTLHTNDAASAATRLIDMGVAGYLVASTLRGILAQRLVRVVCESCKEVVPISEVDAAWLSAAYADQYASAQFYRGRGCIRCNETGYQGRQGIFELLEFDEPALDALRRNDDAGFVSVVAKTHRGQTLLDSALALAIEGKTSLSEVQRVAGGLD